MWSLELRWSRRCPLCGPDCLCVSHSSVKDEDSEEDVCGDEDDDEDDGGGGAGVMEEQQVIESVEEMVSFLKPTPRLQI